MERARLLLDDLGGQEAGVDDLGADAPALRLGLERQAPVRGERGEPLLVGDEAAIAGFQIRPFPNAAEQNVISILRERRGDVAMETAEKMLREADCSPEQAEAIYQLTSLCTFEDRFVIPPAHREEALEMMKEPHEHRQEAGFGFLAGPRRGQ